MNLLPVGKHIHYISKSTVTNVQQLNENKYTH